MASPTLEAWLPAAKELNPTASDEALTSYYQQKYGPAPSSLPTLQSWLPNARKANPEADDDTLTNYWQAKYGAHGAKEKESTQGDMARGFKDDLKQLPQLGYGLLAGAGSVAESIVGEGGLATGIKKAGVKGFEEKGREIAAESKPSDSFNYSYDRAKEGDFGALVDWAQYSLGHAGAQALESLGAFAAGTAVGGPVVGAATAGGKAMVGKVATDFMGRLVAKESARLAASGAAKGLAAEEVTKLATANVAKKIGQTTALALQATGMEGGEIMGDLAAKSVEEGRELTGEELAKGFGATLGAGALEFVGDKIGLDLVLGKSKAAGLAASAPGTAGRAARGTLAGVSGAMAEGATEFAQTLVEEAGKGNDPFSDASVRQAIDAAAMGTVGGGAMGATGGILSSAKTPPLTLPTLKTEAPTIDVEDTPAQLGVTSPEVSVDDAIAKATSILSAPVGSDRKKADDLSTRLATRMDVQDGRLPTAQEAAMLADTIPQRRPEIPILPGAPESAQPSSDIQIVSPPSKPPVSVDDPRATIAAERQRILAMKQNAPAAPPAADPAATATPATPDAPMPTAVDQAYASVPELLELAKKKGLDPETAIFKEYTKMVTGKAHLDELTPQERDKLAAKLGRVGTGDPTKAAPPASNKETAPAPTYAAPHQAATVPRSELSPENNADMLLRAEKAQADMGAAQTKGEQSLIDFLKDKGGLQDQGGELATMEVDGQRKPFTKKLIRRDGLTLDQAAELAHEAGHLRERDIAELLAAIDRETRAQGKRPDWHEQLTRGRNPLTPDEINTAIEKIIQDEGADVGKAVERVKEALLNDRDFRNTPWGKDADAIMRGEWPSWIPKPEGYTPPQAGPAPSVENPSAPVAPVAPTPQAPTAEAATIDDRAHEAATSPKNDLDEPTEGQKGAGNYKLGHDRIAGLNISIENPEGSTRKGKDANGKPWSVEMKSHYGYIRGTKAADSTNTKKQGIDVFVKPNTPRDYSGPVFVVDQKKANGKFDEHKVMLGYDSLEEARARYKENYSKDWNGIQAIKAFTMDEFKAWLQGDTTQPAGNDQDRINEQKAKLQEKKAPKDSPDSNESKRIQESAGQFIPVDLADAKRWARENFPGESVDDVLAQYKMQTPEQIRALQDEMIEKYVETPATLLAYKLIADGKRPTSSNVYGPGDKGVWWVDPATGTKGFTALDQQVEKPGQQEIHVPPPTIGERPIIAPEAPLSETPLFSKGAQEPEPEQTKLPEDEYGPPTEADIENVFNRAAHLVADARHRWDERRAKGLNDTQLAEALSEEFGRSGGAADNYRFDTYPGKSPRLVINDIKTLQGKELLDLARKVLNIGTPVQVEQDKLEAMKKPKADAKPEPTQPASSSFDYTDQGKRPSTKQIIADWKKAGQPKKFDVTYGETFAEFEYIPDGPMRGWQDSGNGAEGVKRNEVLLALKNQGTTPSQSDAIKGLLSGRDGKLPEVTEDSPDERSERDILRDYAEQVHERIRNYYGALGKHSNVLRWAKTMGKAEFLRKLTPELYSEIRGRTGETPERLWKFMQENKKTPHPSAYDVKPWERDAPTPAKQEAASAATEEVAKPATDKAAAAKKLADGIVVALKEGRNIAPAPFFEAADKSFGGTRASGAYTEKEAYDALELGINLFILNHIKAGVTDGTYDGSASLVKARLAVQDIRARILDRIPTQRANRTEDQNEFQQFSTPPDLAYVMNWAAHVTSADTMLEPSAGIGGIAVFAKLAGARVVMNEYHGPRADLLRQLNIGPVYQENAEQLNNILPDTTRPTVIVMNPPFSSTAGRKQGERSSRNVLRHLDQALARLEPGGRLVALIGQGRDGKDAQFLEEWKKLAGMKYAYRGRIGLSGQGYKKYGTTYDNQILIFDKIKPDGRAPINANVADVFEALPLLSEVRDARTNRSPEQASTQSGSETLAQEGGRRDGSQPAVSSAAPTVGPRGERSGTDAREPSRNESAPAPDRGQPAEQPGQSGGAVVSPARPGGRPDRPATPEPAQSGERPDAGGRGDASPGQPERSGERGPDAGPGLSERLTVEQDEAPEPSAPVDRTESDDSIFESYTPKKVRIKGAQAHPGKLVESAAMAAIDPPDATYKPALPKSVIEEGRLSGAQLEPIVYAGQAHEQLLPDGSRRGFFDGDGTGVGKGREIAGILLDNFKQGRKKAVWMSKNSDLFSSAVRDWKAVAGTDGKELFSQGDLDLGDTITRKDGILFSNYLLLGAGLDLSVDGKLQMKKPKEGAVDKKGKLKQAPTQTRLDQMVKWLGPDFDGVIVFDEAHEMRNNMATSGGRGDKKPAMKALAGVELQKRFPKARIAYFSATGGIEVSDFGYAERLGMWGNGTPFANKLRFVGEIQQGGLAAMELVSQDLKANGLYTSRSLSYDDVTYDRLEHVLTADQREMYDEMAKGWQIALQNLNRIMEVTGADKNGAAKSAARSLFWVTHQRFYEQVLTSLQMPTVIKRMEKDLEAGHAVVIQLTKTNAAPQDKQIKLKNREGGELDDLDLTPREGFLNYVRDGFPTQEFETYIDENGNERSRPVVDSNGAPVQNKEAVEMRDALLERLGSLRTPENPLDLIINTFGEETVAEVTGRGQRLVRKTDKDGKRTTVLQKRSKTIRNKDAAEFMDDKRQVLVFSDAGGTGQSYHADLSAKNQRRRMHYVIQPGWRADAAMQGLGRTHRSNAASSPHYVLVSTDLKGHKRFISTIARRLAQLGALTRGQRQTSSQGLFSEADNLENAYAASSLEAFFRALKRGDIKGHGWQDTLDKLGLQGILDKNGNIMPDKLPDVPQFLNRILSLEYADQNELFDAWFSRMEAAIEMAKANGQFDSGMENYRADSITLKKQQVVYENPETKATTRLMTFEAKHRLEFRDYKATTQRDKFHGFFIGQKTGKIYAALRGYQHTDKEGKVEEQYKLLEPDVDKVRMVGEATFTKNYRKITGKEAEKAWKEAIDKAPKTRSETLHILSGAMLGIWDRIGGSTRVYRVTTDDGKRTVGRVIGADALVPTLERLGVKADKAEAPSVDMALDAIENGGTVELANGWKLGTRRVNGEDRIEIMGYGVYGFREELKGYGAFVESIRFEPRVFIPTENPKPIIEKVVKRRPILKITGTGPDKGPGGGGSGPSFQRREGAPPRLGAAEMRAVAGRIDAGDTRVVVTSFDALPNRIKEEAAKLGAPADEIRAVYDKGTVYLVEDRFESEADAEEAVFHELYHKWIAGHLGSSMQDDLNALFDRMGGPEALLTLADRYQWKEARAVMQSYAKRTDLSRREKTAAVVNELLAEMGSRSINPTALQKIKAFIGAIRQWLRDHGLATLSTVTESDLLHLLERARSTHGELKAQGNRPYFQSTAPHPTFYSQAALVVERKMPNKASADQVRAILSPNNGVKPDELKWLGLDDYLKTKDTFTKQDVLDFISQNQVQVKEVMKAKGELPPPYDASQLTIEEGDHSWIARDRRGLIMGEVGKGTVDGREEAEAYLRRYIPRREAESAQDRVRDDTKFSGWQLHGGKNYRELLLTLPTKKRTGGEAERIAQERYGKSFDELNEAQQLDITDDAPEPSIFKSSHFSEPNILAHVRFNDRMVDGKRVLFLEEVQSDWHQQGRKGGYKGRRWGLLDSKKEHRVIQYFDGTKAEAEAEAARQSEEMEALGWGANAITAVDSMETVPDAPFKKTWHELALKRMLRYAAEHGYDSLAWTTGEQQAERYDLSKHVEDIGYEKRGDLYNVTVWGKDGQQLWQNQSATLQQVEETIGKELADKMQKGEGTKAGSLRYFSGLDLKVGGDGMKGFYDAILPAFLNKYGKKWGAKVGDIEIGITGPGRTMYDENGNRRPTTATVHALPITDAMKASVMTEGQPLFQTRTSQADLPDLTETPYVPDMVRGPQQSLLPTQGAIAYELPAMSKMDDVIRTLQDKNIDLARLVDTIKEAGHEVHDDLNPVLKEELYLGRVSKQTQDFLTDELRPLVDAMRINKVTMEELDEYLHARHAREANEKLAAINPDREDNEALSGMTNEEADRILREADRPKMDRLAARVDSILAKTRRLLVDYGLESQETVNAWMHEYSAYVPLHREGYEDGTPGTGQGRSVRGPHAKARTGSNLKVTNILANVAMDREKAIVRGEKMRPVIALAGLLQQFPNSDIATLTKPADITYTNPDTGLLERVPGDIGEYRVPMVKGINRKTGEVEMRPDPTYKGRDNVVNFRLNGVDHAIVFNEHNDRAVQMARALKDLDVGQLNTLLASVAPATRYLASINTQFNPVFGVVNFIRDIQFAMLTLGTTPLANKRAEVRAATFKAIKGIYQDARAVRRGEHPTSPVAQLWERFQKVGGPTGYRDMFRGSNDRAKAIEHMLNPDWWQKTLPGRILTAGGRLSGIEQAILDKAAKPLFEWLSDYNQAMENAVRLGVFQVGLENGMSDEQAASAAKNITVNFNKKGQITTQVGALYAFFNASVQGTARIAQTLFEKGQFGVLSDVGKKIVQGGIALGALQAFALSMAGFEDEEPPEWMKARSLIIPVPGTDRGYVSIPMPLGFNVLPSLGRLAAESLIHGKPIERAYQFIGTFVDAFSPVGGAGTMSQFLAPTAVDPFVALSENKDWTGRSIYREDFNRLKPTPGMTRAKDTASPWARGLAEAINWATGGTEYTPGHFSPTPDSIDYLIAQMAGGVGREASKAAQTLTGLASGEEVPMHKIPLAGRLVGSASDLAARRHAFYDNLREVTMHGEEVEGRRRNREDAAGYLKEHPEAQLSVYAGQAERQVQDLTRRKRELLRQEGNSERARLLDMQIDRVMERFNERVKQAQGGSVD